MGGLPAPQKQAMAGGEKYDMDSEGVQVTPDGRMLVSFEQQHRIVLYDGVPPRRVLATRWHTPAMRWAPNGGGEALALLPDGATLWLPEQAQGGQHRGIFTDAAGRSRSMAIARLPGFAITDAVALGGTRVLLLNRRFTGLETAAALSVIDIAAVRAGPVMARLLLRWDRDSAWPIDNMEGAALVREAGRPVLYLVSDDNFSAAQRTLLMRLELPEGVVAIKASGGPLP